jgi:hypothetical protein
MRSGWAGFVANARKASPTAVPMAKVIADIRNGGTFPDAAVSCARSAHMATAEKPINVARDIASMHPPCPRALQKADR